MRNEAEVHAVQLEALLAVKRALATEVLYGMGDGEHDFGGAGKRPSRS